MHLSLKREGLLAGLIAATLAYGVGVTHAATAIATVDATIINTMGIATITGLGFGDISAGSVAGTVVLAPTGVRSTTGGATLNNAIGASVASFDLTGTPNATFSITLPISAVLSDGGVNTMMVDNFTSSPTGSGVLDSSGKMTLYVGATLNVGGNQTIGGYTGQMTVTVDYN